MVDGEPESPDRIPDYGNVGGNDAALNLVRAVHEAFARRDVEAVLELADDEVVFVPTGTASLVGRVEPYTGHEGLRRYFADVEHTWDDLLLVAEDLRATTGGVVVFGRIEGRVDGVQRRQRVMWTWRIRNGRVWSMRATPLGGDPQPGG